MSLCGIIAFIATVETYINIKGSGPDRGNLEFLYINVINISIAPQLFPISNVSPGCHRLNRTAHAEVSQFASFSH